MYPKYARTLFCILVAAHLAVNFWHGSAHGAVEISLTGIQTAFVIIVILIGPVLGAIMTWTRYALLGCWLGALALTGSLVFGVYNHYVRISSDNVAHLPAATPDVHADFISSAGVTALLALAGALIGFYLAGRLKSNSND